MVDMNIKEQLKNLVELQKIDSQIYSFQKELKVKPIAIQELSDKFEESKSKLKSLEEEATRIKLQRKEKEVDLNAKEEEIAKANAQLSQIKTNKEYTAKIAEIENIKADKAIFEEGILASYDESDKVTQQIDKEKENVAVKEKEYVEQKGSIEKEIKDIESQCAALETERQKIIPSVDKTLFARYERILRHKEGLAIVPINVNSCGGCFMNVTSQQINAAKMLTEIIECEMCSRILYIEEDLL